MVPMLINGERPCMPNIYLYIRNKIWTLSKFPHDHETVGCKWVFKIKNQS